MAKLWIFAVLVVAVLVQISHAVDIAEALNNNIRQQLNLYDKLLKEADSAKFADDLKKLIELTEGALKTEAVDEKNKIISTAPSHFTDEFNSWIGAKVEESQVNSDIHNAIEYYTSLLSSSPNEHEADIKKAVSTLENLLQETNLKQKEEQFLGLENTFSPEFQNFIKQSALPSINSRLQKSVEFFGNVLSDKDIKFAQEIEALKTKAAAVLESSVSVDDKTKVLQEITFTNNEQLNEFLHQKNIEYS